MAASKHTTSITTGLAYSYWSVQTLDAQKTGRDWPVMSGSQKLTHPFTRTRPRLGVCLGNVCWSVRRRIFVLNPTLNGQRRHSGAMRLVRYAWPAELDLMARLAGMRRRERWSNWRRDPFTAASANHISIYELPSPQAPEPYLVSDSLA